MSLNHVFAGFGVAFLLAAGLTFAAEQAPADFVEGEVIVRFKRGPTKSQVQSLLRAHRLSQKRRFDYLSARHGCEWVVVRATNMTTMELLQLFRTNPLVDVVEPNHLRTICRIRRPNDMYFTNQWALENEGQEINGTAGTPGADVGFRAAWAMSRIATNEVVIALSDTGVDPLHPDIAPNLWINPREIPDNGIDDDGNGFVDDVWGWDFADNDNNPSDVSTHGTHVSCIAAAAANNLEGVAGVNYKAKILPLKISSDGYYVAADAIIPAAEYVAMMRQRGVNIVALNLSYTSGQSNSAEYASLEAVVQSGVVVCAAAGNMGFDLDQIPFYPACYQIPGLLSIGASENNDLMAGYSNYGSTNVHLFAPGTDIFSGTPLYFGVVNCTLTVGSSNFTAWDLLYAGITTGITATIINCGLGYPTDFPPAVSNNIALIERGELFFSEKVANAMAAGARAVIIYNNEPGLFYGTLGTADRWIPAIAISQEDGTLLTNLAPVQGTVIAWPNPQTIYEFKSGTSMAAPIVAGAVALAAMNFPAESVMQRVNRILDAVTPVEWLQGYCLTGGRLNLARILDSDANGLPDWWEQLYFGAPNGVDPEADPDADGMPNLAEWRAGTNPTNATSKLSIQAQLSGTNLIISWPGAERRFYFVQGSTNPAGAFEHVLATNLAGCLPLTGFTNVISEPVAFFRVGLEPEFAP